MTIETIQELCKQEIDEVVYYDDTKHKEFSILGKKGVQNFFSKNRNRLVCDCSYKPSDKTLYIHLI